MKKLSLKNSDNLTVDEAFADFKGLKICLGKRSNFISINLTYSIVS
ncbi:MAG: hypothetical protein K1W35_05270 [Lachnospiraceae bacterium]